MMAIQPDEFLPSDQDFGELSFDDADEEDSSHGGLFDDDEVSPEVLANEGFVDGDSV